MFELFLIGAPHCQIDGKPLDTPLLSKDLALISYLATTGQAHSRTTLTALLWGEMRNTAARGNLRKSLSALRQALGRYLAIDRQRVGLITERCQCDVWSFEREALDGMAAGDAGRMEAALAFYRGDFMEGVAVRDAPDFDLWLYQMQERLRNLALRTFTTLAAQYRRDGKYNHAIVCLQRAVGLEPWREEAHRQLMVALAESGQRSAALLQYQSCVKSLETELGVEPSLETREIYSRIRAGQVAALSSDLSVARGGGAPQPAGSPSTMPALQFNLPPELKPIIGRDENLAELADLLTTSECRLLSLVGPGGIGKSRLALALAHRLDTVFDGAALVSLVGVFDVEQILPAVAEALFPAFGDGKYSGHDVLRVLKQTDPRLLLIFDNFEQLLPGGIDVLERLLANASRLVCVVTSRETLNTTLACHYEVLELSYPEDMHDPRGTEYPAVQMFLQLARRTRWRQAVQQAELPHVVRICQVVGGLPLGIELAVGQLGRLPYAVIAAKLVAGWEQLQISISDLPPRQHSLQASFETSWRTLTSEEQHSLARLSVMHSDFTLEAALQTSGASVAVLLRLLDKSLVRTSGADRYALHEVIRRLAEEKLAEMPGAADEAFTSYLAFYVGLGGLILRDVVESLRITPDLSGSLRSHMRHLRYLWSRLHNRSGAAAVAHAIEVVQQALLTILMYEAGDSLELLQGIQSNAYGSSSHEDMVSIDVIWLPDLADTLLDLNEPFATEKARLLPALADACCVEGRLVAFPYMLDIGLLYYRQDLLEAYGYGAPPQTWDELEEMAGVIQAGERATGRHDFWGYIWQGGPSEHLVCNALEWQHAEGGGAIVEPDGVVSINNARTIAAFERARRWIGAISPSNVRVMHEGHCANLWEEGRAAFMRLWVVGYSIFEHEIIGPRTRITLLPRGAVRHAATLGGWPLAVRRETRRPAEVFALIKEIAGYAMQRQRAFYRHVHLPTLAALYDDPVMLVRTPVFREIKGLVESGGLAIRPSQVAGKRYGQLSNLYVKAVNTILYEGADAGATLAALEQQLVALGGWRI